MSIRALAVVLSLPALVTVADAGTDVQRNEELIRRYIEEFVNKGNSAALDDVLAPDFVRYGPGTVVLHGRDELVTYTEQSKTRYPDLHITIEEVVTNRATAWVRARYQGTQNETGPSSPIKRRIEGVATSFFRFTDAGISAHHLSYDTLAVSRQLGIEPEPSSSADNGEVVRRVIGDLFNKGRFYVADEVFTSDYRNHGPASDGIPPGPKGMKQRVQRLRQAFPDLIMTIEEMTGEGDVLAVRVTLRGTQAGEFRGMEPTNRRIVSTSVGFHRFENGKIAESWIASNLGEDLRRAAAPPPHEDVRQIGTTGP